MKKRVFEKKAVFEGFVLSINKVEGSQFGVFTQVCFVLMVRRCSIDLHKHKEDKSYWKPVRFCCSALLLRNALELACGDYITVETEKDIKEWHVTNISFAKNEAQDFRTLMALNEEIL